MKKSARTLEEALIDAQALRDEYEARILKPRTVGEILRPMVDRMLRGEPAKEPKR